MVILHIFEISSNEEYRKKQIKNRSLSILFSLPSRSLQIILIGTIKGGLHQGLDNMTPDEVYWDTIPKLKEAV
jgi:hypothetical protein